MKTATISKTETGFEVRSGGRVWRTKTRTGAETIAALLRDGWTVPPQE